MELKLNSKESFHRAVYPILFTAQVFALMPVTGISSKSPYALKFKWNSILTVYSLVVIASGALTLVVEVMNKNHHNSIAQKLG